VSTSLATSRFAFLLTSLVAFLVTSLFPFSVPHFSLDFKCT